VLLIRPYPASNPEQAHINSRRRFWRLGIWFWVVAWTDGFKNIRLPESFGSKRTMARITILIAMPLLILVSDHKTRIAE
jgi:hypothetical protein